MAGALWRVRFVSGAVGPLPHTPSCMNTASLATISFAGGVTISSLFFFFIFFAEIPQVVVVLIVAAL